MKACRECLPQVSEQALACPQCGAPRPALSTWDGWGYEYKSAITVLGPPLTHLSPKYRRNHVPVVAQLGLYVHAGHGQLARSLAQLLQLP